MIKYDRSERENFPREETTASLLLALRFEKAQLLHSNTRWVVCASALEQKPDCFSLTVEPTIPAA